MTFDSMYSAYHCHMVSYGHSRQNRCGPPGKSCMTNRQSDTDRFERSAFAYLRVSGRSQVQGDGFPRQREKICKYALLKGFQLDREFCDGGVSGTRNILEREAFTEMLLEAVAYVVKIIIENADRLARDLITAELAIAELQRQGIEIYSADGDRNLSAGDGLDPTAKLIRQVLASVAEYDKDMKVLRLAVARRRKRLNQGRCEGAKPFGTRDDQEARTVKRIRQLNRRHPQQSHRRTYAEIAEALNQELEAHPSRTGRPWSARMVRNVLDRENDSKSLRQQSRTQQRSHVDRRRRA